MTEKERIEQSAIIRALVQGCLGELSLRQAAIKTGIHYSTIYNLSRGQRVNYASTVAFGRAFGVTDELLKASGYAPEPELPEILDPFAGIGGLLPQKQGGDVVISNPPYRMRYITDPDARMIAEAYEGLPPEIKKFVKEQVLSAADMAKAIGKSRSEEGAREMERSMTAGGTRADHHDNPSRNEDDRIPADDDNDGEGGK